MLTPRILVRALVLGTLLLCSSCSDMTSADYARVTRFLEFWSPHKGGFVLFPGYKDWLILPSPDSEKTRRLGRRNVWEAEEHAKIDSLSDAESMKPVKASMHAFITSVFGIMRIEILLPDAAATIRDEYLRKHSAIGDSVLHYAHWLLTQNDSLALEIQASAQRFNRLAQSLELPDTIVYQRYQVPRREIVYQYLDFLSPEVKECLLAAK
jgi:hypothetical protein